VLPILVALFGKRDLALTTYFSFVVTILTFFTNYMKMAYHGPRPFWSSDDVQAFHCSTQYGNPSGHSMFGFGMPMALALNYVAEKNVSNKGVSAIFGSLAFGASVAYSRLFLGVHSLDQVIFGCAIGLWAVLSVHFILRESLMTHFKSLIAQTDTDYTKWALVASGILITFYGILIGNYYTADVENLAEWDVRIAAKCGAAELEEAYDAVSLQDTGESALGFGSYFGLLFSCAVFPNSASTTKDHTWLQRIGWMLVALVLVIPGAGFLFLPGTDGLDPVTRMILTKFTPYFWLTFVISAFSEKLSISIGLFEGKLSKTHYTNLYNLDIECPELYIFILPATEKQE